MSDPIPVIPLEYAHVGLPLGSAKALRVLTLVAWLACLIGWVLICVEVETVLGTGPIIFLLGLSLLIVGLRARSSRHMILGTTHCAICLLFWGLVLRLRWGPDDATAPFFVMGAIYTAVTAGVSIWVWRGTRTPVTSPTT